jgi:hypothetical protein
VEILEDIGKKKRRLFYLLPRHRDFSFRMIFGDKAVRQIRRGVFPKYVQEMIRNSKKYPEGTPCEFDKDNYEVDVALDLLRIKIEN